jgi:hypothetical protein
MVVNLRTFEKSRRAGLACGGWMFHVFSFPGAVRTSLLFGFALLAALCGSFAPAQAQQATEAPTYRKEFAYGINFNTNGGLIGGGMIRSTHLLTADMSRFWMVEVVEVKHPKEQRVQNPYTGGVYVFGKTNSAFVLRPSVGAQKVIFRKAPDSGVQINGLVGGGPSIALLLPYYIYYDYTKRDSQNRPISQEDIRAEPYSPEKHRNENFIYDHAPLFSGINDLQPKVGAHVRGALTFEYGRYRDAIAGVETGFLFEAYPKPVLLMRALGTPDDQLNNRYFTSVYLTIYIGSRS